MLKPEEPLTQNLLWLYPCFWDFKKALIPEATDLADKLNRVYVKNLIDGKEVKTPSLKWFESVVRNTLFGFLMVQEINAVTQERVKEISLEHGVVQLIASRDIMAGSVVTDKDFNLD